MTINDMDEGILMSIGLYKLTSDIIGADPIIKMRKTIKGLRRNVDRVETMFSKDFEDIILSGSSAEGFKFASSDLDWMIFSLSQCSTSDNNQTVLLAESDITKPGFVLLRLISKTTDGHTMRSCVKYGTKYYLSNSLWVRNGYFANAWPDSSIHGPCRSGFIGIVEVDYAECLKSDIIPEFSKQNFLNLHQAGQLTRRQLEGIYKGGCHFVAISSKTPIEEGLEWRISFSSAEKEIIHSMNQVQFLGHGLLKIFLKETIDVCRDIKGLLCSYFMKTVVFWELLDEKMRWSPQHFLECFWKCLQVLIHWIDVQYCPNFFIPENNMFSNKFTRDQHCALLYHLTNFYYEGIHCLLRCPSLRRSLREFIQLPLLVLRLPFDLDHVSKSILDCELLIEIWDNPLGSHFFDRFVNIVKYLEDTLSRERHQHPYIRVWRNMSLTRLMLKYGCRFENYIQGNPNRSIHTINRKLLSTMKFCCADATSHLLYMAVYLYRCGRYIEALRVTDKAISRLQNPRTMHIWGFSENMYAAAGGETRPILDMLRTAVVFPLLLFRETCIPELYIEHQAVGCITGHDISLPPLVCAHFLTYLCHYHLGSLNTAADVLQEFLSLLHYDNEYHIRESLRAISWEMLGICQEMSGFYYGAYHSYSLALQHNSCDFKSAARSRLINVRRLL